MIPPLTAADFALLREGLRALRAFENHAINLAAQESQSGAQARMLTALGDRQLHMQAIDFQLREEIAHLTGMPEIQHGNTDLTSESTLYPLTREQQAQEANLRG